MPDPFPAGGALARAWKATGPWFWMGWGWLAFSIIGLAKGADGADRLFLWVMAVLWSVVIAIDLYKLARGHYQQPFSDDDAAA